MTGASEEDVHHGEVRQGDAHHGQVLRRVVLLGASNLSLGWPHLMRAVFARFSESLHVYTAHGMGRSYVADSAFGWRTLPGILDCGMWDELDDQSPQVPLNALITDLGNDLVYGKSPETVAAAAEHAIDRLRTISPNAHVVLARPPRESVESLSAWRFHLFRLVLFPSCSLSLRDIIAATNELDERVQELWKRAGVAIVEQPGAWFGLDPIHIRARWRQFAFSQMTRAWPDGTLEDLQRLDVPHRRPTMAARTVRGRLRHAGPPSVRTARGEVSAW